MTNRELFSALGQLDDDLILAAAPQSRRHSSPMLLRWGALAAGLVLAVGIAFAVAPRLPAILPPNTDTSHIQGTTNTTDQTDSSDTETDSSTDANTDSSTDLTTDSSAGTETNTDTPAAPTPFPFSDTVYGIDLEAINYTIPVKNVYEIFASESYSDAAYDKTKESIIEYFRDKATFVTERPNFAGENKERTKEALPGKESISLSLPGVDKAFVFDYHSTSNSGLIDSPYKVIQRIGSVDYYHHPNLDFVIAAQRETGLLTYLFYPKAPDEWSSGEKELSQEEVEAVARELMVKFYGKEALTTYSYSGTSSAFFKKSDNGYWVVYTRMLGNYPTNEHVKMLITKSGYLVALNTFNWGLYPDLEKTLTVDRVEKAKQDVLDAMPDDVMCYLWTIERDINGEYYLSFFCENREKGFEYELTINIK